MDTLTEIRAKIDEIDVEIANLLAERIALATDAAVVRRGPDVVGDDPGDPAREAEVVAEVAMRSGLSEDDVAAAYAPLFAAARRAGAQAAREMAEARAEEIFDEEPPQPPPLEGQLGFAFDTAPKPPYVVPTVASIRANPPPPDAPIVVSTFSGAGGSCLGFRMAGYRVPWANEFIPAARETYLANFPETDVDPRDIREITADEILEQVGRRRGDVDVLEGSPPCASFSMAGRREEHWGQVKKYSETEQRVDDLFFEFARILEGVQPKVFVAENVPGLLLGNAIDVFREIISTLRDCGYVVDARVLNAYHFGVPQARRRLIFVGVRKDLGLKPAYPVPQNVRYSIRDALPWIVRSCDGRQVVEKGVAVELHNPTSAFNTEPRVENVSPTVMAGGIGGFNTSQYRLIVERADPEEGVEAADISKYAIGEEWDRMEVGTTSDKYFQLIRPDPNGPCPTVTQTGGNIGAASVVHPTEKRKFTIPELRRLCSFPDDFELTGTFQQRWERLGRSVPPLMMKAVARTIREELL